jgi:predicted ATP-dependent endonuclease of OLD family
MGHDVSGKHEKSGHKNRAVIQEAVKERYSQLPTKMDFAMKQENNESSDEAKGCTNESIIVRTLARCLLSHAACKRLEIQTAGS